MELNSSFGGMKTNGHENMGLNSSFGGMKINGHENTKWCELEHILNLFWISGGTIPMLSLIRWGGHPGFLIIRLTSF